MLLSVETEGAYGVVVDIFVLESNAELLHVGTRASTSGTIHFTSDMTSSVREALMSWNRWAGGNRLNLHFPLIVFVDVVDWNGVVREYVEVVPLNAEHLDARATVSVVLHPEEILLEELLGVKPMVGSRPNEPIEGPALNLKYVDGEPLFYSSHWCVQKRILLNEQFIPLVLLHLAENGEKLSLVVGEVVFFGNRNFMVGAPVSIISGGVQRLLGPAWYIGTAGEIEGQLRFANARYSESPYSYRDSAILGLGVVGDLLAGTLVKESKVGRGERFAVVDIVQISALVPELEFSSDEPTLRFEQEIDDDPGDGEGFLELYLNYLLDGGILAPGEPEVKEVPSITYTFTSEGRWCYGLPFSVSGVLGAEGFDGRSDGGLIPFMGSIVGDVTLLTSPQEDRIEIVAVPLKFVESVVVPGVGGISLNPFYRIVELEV